MKIWLVDSGDELTCAWTKRSDAIDYFYEEVKRCKWSIIYVAGEEKEEDDYLIYTCKFENEFFTIKIVPLWYDEKPYID